MAASSRIIPLYLFSTLMLGLASNAAFTQADTVLHLSPVTVTASRLQGWQPGSGEAPIDSLQLAMQGTQDVAEALRQQAGLYIRDYGAGNIATASARGASAAHTAVLWNGIPLQDPMLGLTDLSILPVFLFNDIRFIPGGSSALWGSGAVGGVIHLNGQLASSGEWGARYLGELGSFGLFTQGLSVTYGGKAFTNSSRIFYRQAKNDYPYRDIFGKQRQLPNASSRQWGIMQENTFKINAHQQLSVHLWWQEAGREIPPTRVQATSQARQDDGALRTALNWQWTGARSSYIVRMAASGSRLVYKDSLTHTFSDSKTRSLLGELESTHALGQRLHLKAGLHTNLLSAASDAYTQQPRQERAAVFAALRWWNKKERWQAVLNGRQEWVDGTAGPFTPSLSIYGQLSPRLACGLSVSRNYRLPTFNDLYWPQGGNPALKPESGWNQSVFLRTKKQWQQWQIHGELTGFNLNINNWIAWIPQGTYWAPENVRQVWSRGGEARSGARLDSRAGIWSLQAQYSFTRSTSEQSVQPGDASLHRQLIYTPAHQARASLSWQYQGWYAAYIHEWAGKVYTLPDHSEALPSASVGMLQASYSWLLGKAAFSAYLSIDNCWDNSYERVINRPMPGRGIRVGIRGSLD
ncbi:MAG: TonB-dependent receptor plug domain-containing protein [Phaeodactylibacter sp.]|nr:TonB-dependent receptor plug domain-containing protein [Phaeodactylibacter sp.]